MTQGNNWLDENFTGYNAVHGAGVPVPQRKVLNFGAGLTVGDDPTTGVTTITGTGSAPLLVTALVTTPPLNPSVQEFYIASAYSTPGDGGGGTFVWNPTDTRSADGGRSSRSRGSLREGGTESTQPRTCSTSFTSAPTLPER